MDLGTLIESYQYIQTNHPLIGSMMTAEVTFTLGDAISQLIVDKKIDSKKIAFTAQLALLYGL